MDDEEAQAARELYEYIRVRNNKMIDALDHALNEYINRPVIDSMRSYMNKRQTALIQLIKEDDPNSNKAKRALDILESKAKIEDITFNAMNDMKLKLTCLEESIQQNNAIVSSIQEEFERLSKKLKLKPVEQQVAPTVSIAKKIGDTFKVDMKDIDWAKMLDDREERPLTNDQMVIKKRNKGICRFCGKVFAEVKTATRHAKESHVNPDRWKCITCANDKHNPKDRSFSRYQNAQDHVRNTHSGKLIFLQKV